MKDYTLKLYVTGKTTNSERALSNLQDICEKELSDIKIDIQVIDVLEKPQLAENDKILATPTLIRMLPPPIRRIVGDLSDREKILIGLDIDIQNGTNLQSK